MAGFLGKLTTAEIALTAATAKTVLQLRAAATTKVKLLGWGIYFDGVSTVGEPVQVRLLRQTTNGTMTSLTAVKHNDSDGDTLQTAGGHTATAEPTAGDVLDVKEVHPQGGYEIRFPLGQEELVGQGDRVGIEATAPANVNCRAQMLFEE